MSTLCVIGAVRDRIVSFTDMPLVATFDEPVSVANAQVYPSYIVILDEGTVPDYEFEHTVSEVTTLTLMIYADTLDDVAALVEKVKYNGGAINAGLGLDFGTLPTLATNYGTLEVRRMSETYFAAQATGKSAQRIHGCRMGYRVSLYRYT